MENVKIVFVFCFSLEIGEKVVWMMAFLWCLGYISGQDAHDKMKQYKYFKDSTKIDQKYVKKLIFMRHLC